MIPRPKHNDYYELKLGTRTSPTPPCNRKGILAKEIQLKSITQRERLQEKLVRCAAPEETSLRDKMRTAVRRDDEMKRD